MRILLTGATGFLGRSLLLALQREGHEVFAWVRDIVRAKSTLGADVRCVVSAEGRSGLLEALEQCDAVIHLAGAPILGQRWSQHYRDTLWQSRVGFLQQLKQLWPKLQHPPQLLISANAVGIYGDRGENQLVESSPYGYDFLAELCQTWEKAANELTSLGVRAVTLRLGVVLGVGGGALDRLVPLFRLGLGGDLGSGQQFLPWVHLFDAVAVMERAIKDTTMQGPYNVTSPHPVRQKELATLLAERFGPWKCWPVPSGVLRFVLGEGAVALLSSQRALPERLLQAGFTFHWPTLQQALDHLLPNDTSAIGPISSFSPTPVQVKNSSYLFRRPPKFVLQSGIHLLAPRSTIFPFFSDIANLGLMTPIDLALTPTMALPERVEQHTTMRYSLSIAGFSMRWLTKIAEFVEQEYFIDTQEKGPYHCWWHEHHFSQQGNTTYMEDRVFYNLPLGYLGYVAHALFVRHMLQRIFLYRYHAMSLRFGVSEKVEKSNIQ